jgi:hypothetical protein
MRQIVSNLIQRTVSTIFFFNILAAVFELYVAGMEPAEVLKTRAVTIPMMILTGRLYGEMLQDLKDYVATKDFSSNQKLTSRYAKIINSVGSLSTLLNQRYIDSFGNDPILKPHGFYNTYRLSLMRLIHPMRPVAI